jgi:hypothetical protein
MGSVHPQRRWCRVSADRLIMGLLALQILLFLSQHFRWFAFNEKKGWTVLIALGVLGLAFAVMLTWCVASLVFRWRFQFGLRSFLRLVLAIAVPLAWLAAEMRQAQQQRQAVAAIRLGGGQVQYDYVGDSAKVFLETTNLVEPQRPAPEWLLRWIGEDFFAEVLGVYAMHARAWTLDCTYLEMLPQIRTLDLSFAQVADAELKSIARMSNLETLSFYRTPITDAGLAHLQELIELRELFLSGTEITGDGLEHLRGLTKLRRLVLNLTPIADGGLAHLRGLTELRELHLYETPITDLGLAHLRGLSRLRHLDLTRTALTDAGLENLSELRELEIIALGGTQITDDGLIHLRELPKLQGLRLTDTRITDAGLESLSQLTNLEWVTLENTRITDAGLAHLKGMPRLRTVVCRGTQVSSEVYLELLDELRHR